MSLAAFSSILLRTPLQSLRTAFHISCPEPIFEEGLYLASTEFWHEYKKPELHSKKEADKLALSLSKYWLRSCTRCTPYGTFAGSSPVPISNEPTILQKAAPSCHTRRIRVDTNYLAQIIAALTSLPHIARQLRLYPNNSIYTLNNGIRYAEYSIDNDVRSYHLSSVQHSAYLRSVLDWAANGETTARFSELLAAQEGVSVEEAAAFIADMVASQLLQSSLEPCVTGKEPLDTLIEQLEILEDTGDILSGLKQVQQLIRNPQEGVAHYQAIEAALQGLSLNITAPKHRLQTDLFLSMEQANINSDLINAIMRQAEDLLCLARQSKNGDLEQFRKRFYERYEGAEVPLAIALDADLGIGYAGVHDEGAGSSPIIEKLAAINGFTKSGTSEHNYIQQFALTKFLDWLKDGSAGVVITEDELKAFKKQAESFRFSPSMYLMGSLMKDNSQLDAGHFCFDFTGMGGPSAGNLLGRFTQGDARIEQLTKEALQAEEATQPDAIFAEIVHLPQARIGNILLRPVLRAYEIPYVGRSGASPEQQIPVDDLMVSIRNNEVYLRSRKHNRRVIPRLTTAHNYSFQSLPVYKFLCDLQMQGLAHPAVWDWGVLSSQRHLPRISYKNLILHKAKWKIGEKDIEDLPKDKTGYISWAESFCAKYKLPQRVVYCEADNELLIDFCEPPGIELFLYYLRRHKQIQLEEFLFTEENCIVTDGQGQPFTNEIIIPLILGQKPVSEALPAKMPGATTTRRKFAPGSEWQYYKIYCGSKTAEKLLTGTILPFVETGLRVQLFGHCFFVRYRDDFGHFRIRFYNRDTERQAALQQEFTKVLQPLLDDGLIDKVCTDTYNREIERYGADTIEAIEILFHNDSLSVLRFLQLLEDAADAEKYRLLFALRGIDMLLDDFGLTLSQKQTLLKSVQEGYFREFGGSPVLQKQLNEKYRQHRRDIATHMDAALDATNEIEEPVSVFAVRSQMNVPVAAALKAALGPDEGAEQLFGLLHSCLHMFMNRMFIAQQRKYELVVYHFLEKHYSSQLAFARHAVTKVATLSEHV